MPMDLFLCQFHAVHTIKNSKYVFLHQENMHIILNDSNMSNELQNTSHSANFHLFYT